MVNAWRKYNYLFRYTRFYGYTSSSDALFRYFYIHENFAMSSQPRQQRSIKDHFSIAAKTEEIVVNEPKIHPLFLCKKKTNVEKAKPQLPSPKPNMLVTKDNLPKPITPKKKVKKQIPSNINCHNHLDTIIKADTQQFYATQKRNRTPVHHQPLKAMHPHQLDLETIEKHMDTHYPQLWKKDPCCKTLFANLPHMDRTNKRILWRDRYRPNAVEGLVGYLPDYEYLRDWLNQLKIKDATTSPIKQPSKTKKKKGMQKEEGLYHLMLLVGGHGLGKTATVYTVAKETGYSVFEINSASRRTGKDVTESVGEMTASHLVRFDSHHLQPKKRKGEVIILRDTVKPKKPKTIDIAQHFKRMLNVSESKQEPEPAVVVEPPSHTLASFFKKAEEINQRKKEQEKLDKQLKQSLILLEEVDVLFEEDKGFWAAVVDLCQKSKRPIIMTCNGKIDCM
jgi:dephospho-CoA kinase